MLLILAIWIYVLVVAYLYGHAFISLLKKYLEHNPPKIHFSVHVLAGFALLAAITSYFTLFIKIGLVANLLVLAGAVLYAILNHKLLVAEAREYKRIIQKVHYSAYLIVGCAVMLALVLSALPGTTFDKGLYYMQTMKWIENYPVVYGLGNLHLKFSFNSSWLVLSSLFNFSFLGLRMDDLNGLLFVVMMLYAAEGLNAIVRKQHRFSDVFKVATLVPLHLLVSYMISPSADFVIPYLLWMVLILFMVKIEQNRLQELDSYTLLILLFSVFAVCIKLSAAPIALISLYLLVLQIKKGHPVALLPIVTLTLFLVLPWFMRNVIISGYLVYPFYQLDIFNVDWKVPVEYVKHELLETKAFARVRRMDFEKVSRLSLFEWLPYWFRQLQGSQKLLALLNAGILLFLPFYFIKHLREGNVKGHRKAYVFLLITVCAGILFWFSTAPHYRYGIAFTSALYLICFSYLAYVGSKKYAIDGLIRLAPLVVVLLFAKPYYETFLFYKYSVDKRNFTFLPGEVRTGDMLEVYHQGQVIRVPPSTGQCWDAPLPCAPFVINGLELRTGAVEGGFRITRPDSQEYSRKRLESMKINGEKYNIL